jgi:V-type H+-transporting ATPase subunit C
VVQEFADGCRDRLKAIVREFQYRENLFEDRAKERKALEEKAKTASNALAVTCEVSFSEMFTLNLHVKMLRCLIESVMRFGQDQVLYAVLTLKQGKEKDALKALTQHESIDKAMYGTKDELEDVEDFFPFISMPVTTL